MRPTHYLSRRAVLAGLGTTAVAATLAACATSGSSGSKSGGAAGEGDASPGVPQPRAESTFVG